MKIPSLLLLFTTLALAEAPDPAEIKVETKPTPPAESAPLAEPVVREGEITIDGELIRYDVTTGMLQLKKDDGTPRASIFHVSYLRKDTGEAGDRPVTFAFNGGPGSSAVWLHLGMLGPYRVDLPGDGTRPPKPPTRLIENAHSILDVSDLVLVDPVSTGYSRAEEKTKPSEFHGFREDVESLGDFIRRWVTEHGRWASPKFLIGESYGGMRVSGLAQHLQSRYGMSLNGVVLLSSLLDFQTLSTAGDNLVIYPAYLSTYASVAHHHGKVAGDLDTLRTDADAFAFGDYWKALLQGNALEPDRARAIAAKLAELTGVAAEVYLDHQLRLSPSAFRAELLRGESQVIGRFDARVAWEAVDPTRRTPSYDPSFSLAYGAFSTAMLSYLGSELGWEEDSPYEILTGKVHPWNWGAENRALNVSSQLLTAMRDNPHLNVLVMKGLTDLATPPGGIEHTLRQMVGVPESILERISETEYAAGHMFYLNPPDLKKGRRDLVEFIRIAQ